MKQKNIFFKKEGPERWFSGIEVDYREFHHRFRIEDIQNNWDNFRILGVISLYGILEYVETQPYPSQK